MAIERQRWNDSGGGGEGGGGGMRWERRRGGGGGTDQLVGHRLGIRSPKHLSPCTRASQC